MILSYIENYLPSFSLDLQYEQIFVDHQPPMSFPFDFYSGIPDIDMPHILQPPSHYPQIEHSLNNDNYEVNEERMPHILQPPPHYPHISHSINNDNYEVKEERSMIGDFPNQPGRHECDRICSASEPPKKCYYLFIIESHTSMGKVNKAISLKFVIWCTNLVFFFRNDVNGISLSDIHFYSRLAISVLVLMNKR